MKKALIVDDKSENLYLLEVLFKSKDFNVVLARNGQEALTIAAREKPDVIISDILMPGMDGFSLCRELKKDKALSQIPFIFYTATYTDDKDEEYALSLGAEQFIRKPIQPDLFLNQIDRIISDSVQRPKPRKPPIKDEEESYRLYSERLILKLEKKMFDLEAEIETRKAVEKKLRHARNEWEETFQAIGSPALLLDPDFNIIHANRAAKEGLHVSENELIGKKCYEVLYHTGQRQSGCPMEKLLKSKESVCVETEIEALGGTYLLTCAPIKNENGELEKIIHIAIDINDRKKIEDKLQESEERFRQLVESINGIFWIRDAQNVAIHYISPIFETIFGIPVERMYEDPLTFMDVIVKEDRQLVRQSYVDQKQFGNNTDITYRIAVDDEVRWMRSRGFPIVDDNGNVVRVAGVTEDITEAHLTEVRQKQLEGQLLRNQKLEAIGTLAGGIAHDFNNILSSIVGFTELTLGDLEPGSSAHQNLNEVLSAGDRAKELVKRILTLARHSEDECKPSKISSIVKETLKLIRASIPSNIEIIQDIDSDSLVFAPPTNIHQVMMNLLTNAAHATQLDGGSIDVSLSDVMLEQSPVGRSVGFVPGNYLRIRISDTGVGIPEENMDKILNPYFTTKDIGEGTGLGLSITQGIIQNCGGYLLIDSVVGRGTTFTVFLPITKRKQTRPSKIQAIPTGSERILIVDDEPAIVAFTTQMLKQLGYDITSCSSSVEAMALFKAKPDDIDLVLTDMTMPNMTGDKLATELMKIRPNLPIVLCTGYSNKVSDQRAAELGIRAFAMKPLARDNLAEIVRNVLDEAKISTQD